MKTTLIAVLAMAALAVAPVAASASTYAYVATNGTVSTVAANSAAEALTVSNLADTSGVILVTDDTLIMSGFVPASGGTYAYVNVNGGVSTVVASNPSQALTVSNLADTSGVMLIAR